MYTRIRPSAHAVVLSGLMLVSACGGGGGGGGSSPSPPPAPPANRAPTLTTTAASTNEDTTLSVQVAASDPDNNPLTFALSVNPQHGTATLTATGALTYVPASNYSGADSLTVSVSDNAGGQVTGAINVTVTAVNDAPVLTTTSLVVKGNEVLTAQLAGTDVEGDAFTFQFVPGAGHGQLVAAASGALTYTPDTNYTGADQVRVRLVETTSALVSAEQVVSIEVRPPNRPPVANDDALRVTVTAGQPIVVAALANDVDLDGDTLTPAVVSQPRGGAVTVNSATHQLVFEPTNGYVGPIEFTYRVSDGTANSNVATARAVIGQFESIAFLSDYTTPGLTEVHLFDGLEVRRVSDALPAGYKVASYSVTYDLSTLVYVADSTSDTRVYVKPLDGSAPAVLRYTTQPKSPPLDRGVQAYLNADGSYLLVNDYWFSAAKHMFVVNVATGASTRVGENMPGIVDTRYLAFHPYEPKLLMVQGQTAGPVPGDSTIANTAFIGDATDARTLTQIGRNYSAGEYGSGEGFYYGSDPRYVYHGEFRRIGNSFVINILAYDRTAQFETAVVRNAFPPDRGINGTGWISPNFSRMCFAIYEPTTTTIDGPATFYAMNLANPASATPVSPIHNDTSQCAFASDNRTMIYRIYAPNRLTQQAYAIDSVSPGVPLLLAPNGEANSKQAGWHPAPGAMRIAVAYFDNDGNASVQNQVGRYYSMPLDGSGNAFLFSDTYTYAGYPGGFTTFFYDANHDGSFLLYGRPKNGIAALELMSTHGLNLSIPLSRAGETVGVRSANWLHRYLQ